MRPIKKSSSGLLLTQKNNLFKLGNYSSVAYNKHQEKANIFEFELERHKETIIKLEIELNEKNKELKEILTKNRMKKNKFQMTINIIEQLLKICDKKKEEETDKESDNIKTLNQFNFTINSDKSKDNFKSINIENDNDTDNYNKTNRNTFYTTNNNYNKNKKSLPKIKSPNRKLAINTNSNFNTKKKFSDILYMNTLRKRIDTLNDEIGKKDGEIDKLKIKNNFLNYSKLQTDFISNYNSLGEMKSKNVLMLSKLDDIAENFFFEQENNKDLKIRLSDFQEKFYDYKNNINKKINDLENKLKIYEKKNKECLYYHLNKDNFLKNNRSLFEQNKSEAERIENIKIELNELKKENNKKSESIINLKKEIENLVEKKITLNNKNLDKNADIEKLKEQIILLNKKYKEIFDKNKEMKKKLKESENNYINEIYKIGDIKNKIIKADKNIDSLKKEIEKLKTQKNINFLNIIK